ncbi:MULTISPECIES: DUF2812 domain-containing protein [Enterococcus]|uniref:DUF2812 domain-containing protein n=1 Tax=Enterococcus sp. AZ103 TaxID=2774628 RepID=UPI003F202E2E
MGLFEKKYLLSLGVAFYPEKEMLRLEKQAAKGWEFEKLNIFGFLVFKKGVPQNRQYAVDYFSGKSEDLSEYLEMYQISGWQKVSDFRKKYYFFSADKDTPSIFSDEESYREKFKLEWRYNFLRSLIYALFGFIVLVAISFIQAAEWPVPNGLLLFIAFFGLFGVFFPIGIFATMLFYKLFYRDRTRYYNQPDKFAKKQSFIRDQSILMIIGAVIGAVIGVGFALLFSSL